MGNVALIGKTLGHGQIPNPLRLSGIRTAPNASKRRLTVALITLLLAAVIGIPDASGQAATDLGLGSKHTCVVLASGLVQCWGESSLLGDGTYTYGYSSSPRSVAGIVNAAAVECSNYHCCAVLADGEVRCWGSNQGGRLGVPGPHLVRNPVTVSLPTTATGIGAGAFHTCALLTDGRVFCWGENLLGQLGDGTRTVIATPPNPPKISETVGISTATAVTVGGRHSCALLADGSVRCWGVNSLGQLGVST